MKIAIFAMLCSIVMLNGCNAQFLQPDPAPAPQSPQETWADRNARLLNVGLPMLFGSNIQAAVRLFGYPTSQREVVGDTVYVWTNSFELPATISSGPMAVWCSIEIGTDRNGIIKNARYDGAVGVCSRYALAFGQ